MNHPITPPPELVQQWKDNWVHGAPQDVGIQAWLVTQAANWGYQQAVLELEDFLRRAQ